MTDTIITGPAVTLDQAALRAWLNEEHIDGDSTTTTAEELGIDDAYDYGRGGLFEALDSVLTALTVAIGQTVLKFAYDVKVGFFRTYDGDSEDGLVIIVDLGNGLRLATPPQDYSDLTRHWDHSTPLCYEETGTGFNAIVAGLTNIAREANRLVISYRYLALTRERGGA
jgi:hypothetical protein